MYVLTMPSTAAEGGEDRGGRGGYFAPCPARRADSGEGRAGSDAVWMRRQGRARSR